MQSVTQLSHIHGSLTHSSAHRVVSIVLPRQETGLAFLNAADAKGEEDQLPPLSQVVKSEG